MPRKQKPDTTQDQHNPIDSLFYFRTSVGKQLNEILVEQKISKAEFAEKTGISRPTINKILSGEIDNRKTFETHLKKIMKSMNLTSSSFASPKRLSTAEHILAIMEAQNIDTAYLAKKMGCDEKTVISWITAKSEPTKKQLSNLATILNTSTNALTGDSFFPPQLSILDDFISKNNESDIKPSGFYGHIGIKLPHREHILWFPVTVSAMQSAYRDLQINKFVVIPCLNNRLLLANTDNIEKYVFLDDAVDAYHDWELETIDFGDIPLEHFRIFEALADDMDDIPIDLDEFDQSLVERIRNHIKEENWDADYLRKITEYSTIHYRSGNSEDLLIENYSDIASKIEWIYCEEDMDIGRTLVITNDETEELISIENLSLLTIPLLKIDAALTENWDE